MQAYHDMATHDATTGTGGLDGSIVFELDRPEVSCARVPSPRDMSHPWTESGHRLRGHIRVCGLATEPLCIMYVWCYTCTPEPD
jgi:hypothetical protein